jgi:hypothetical protein
VKAVDWSGHSRLLVSEQGMHRLLVLRRKLEIDGTVKLFPAAANCNPGQTMRRIGTRAQRGVQCVFTYLVRRSSGPGSSLAYKQVARTRYDT